MKQESSSQMEDTSNQGSWNVLIISLDPKSYYHAQKDPRWQVVLNWAHRSVDKHTTHMIDHTIYSIIEEWNSAKMAFNCEWFSLIKE